MAQCQLYITLAGERRDCGNRDKIIESLTILCYTDERNRCTILPMKNDKYKFIGKNHKERSYDENSSERLFTWGEL